MIRSGAAKVPNFAGTCHILSSMGLIIVRGYPRDDRRGSDYYEWKPPAFRLLRKVQPVR